jgi:alpha-L-fucosidase
LGQRIAAHRIEFLDGSEWREVTSGTTVGYKRIHWKKFKAQRVRLVITRSRACPLVNSFQIIQSPKDI